MSDQSRDSNLERALPSSPDAERAILGGIILDNAVASQAIEILTPEDFYIPSHRKIFLAIMSIFARGSKIAPVFIAEELKKDGMLESVGGMPYITNLTYGLPHSTNIEHYAKVLQGKTLLRAVIREASKIVQEALEAENEPEIILDHAEAAIFGIGATRLRTGFVHIQPVAEELIDKIQAMEGRSAVITGLATGFNELDKMLSGLQQKDLIIVAARPSTGKTAFALMLAENATKQLPGSVVGIFSLEMSKEALAARLLCANGNIDAQRLRNGFLSRPEWAMIATALGNLAASGIFIDDSASIGALELMAKGRRLALEQKRLDLIIVDYLGLMANSNQRFESRQQEISGIVRSLKIVAKELNVPVVALSQLSRAPESRSDHRPVLSDLRDSGELEQTADVVAFIYRDDMYYDAESHDRGDRKNIAEIIVAKQRNGPTGTVDLRWTPSSMRFDNIYREE